MDIWGDFQICISVPLILNFLSVEEKLELIQSNGQELYDYRLDPSFIKKEPDTLLKESLDIEEEVVIEREHRVNTDKLIHQELLLGEI